MSSSIYGGRGFGTGNVSRQGASGDIIPRGYTKGQLKNFTPEQIQLFQSLFPHVNQQSFLSMLAGGDPQAIAQTEAPALRQFGEMQGGIASRFSGMGTGARGSSGFQNTMSQASSDFAQQLQSKRLSTQQEALRDLFGLSQTLLGQKPTEQFLIQKQQEQKKPSFWQQLVGGLGGLLSKGFLGF